MIARGCSSKGMSCLPKEAASQSVSVVEPIRMADRRLGGGREVLGFDFHFSP